MENGGSQVPYAFALMGTYIKFNYLYVPIQEGKILNKLNTNRLRRTVESLQARTYLERVFL